MSQIHTQGEMAVWSEDKWAAFEGELQSELRAERRRLKRLAAKRQRRPGPVKLAGWMLLSAALVIAVFF